MTDVRSGEPAGVGPIDVVVVGSINVDQIVHVRELPRPGITVTGGTLTTQTGGKGANQAVAAACAGARVAMVGVVGDDDAGRTALAALEAAGVRTSSCAVVGEAATGVALIVVDAAGENQIAVASGANALLDAERARQALGRLQVGARSVCLLGFEVGDEALVAAASWAADRGLRVVVNPGPARPIAEGLLAARPILTPNRAEARQLGGREDAVAAAASIAERSDAPVLVTMGAEGALLLSGPGADPERLAPYRVAVVDATGAGDAFNGILAAELARGAALPAAARWAMAGAALSTRSVGAQAGLPTRAQVAAFLAADERGTTAPPSG